ELKHQDKEQVRAFYAHFSGRVIVGLEASGYSPWFEALLEELGCEVWLGHATEIRRRARWRQKNDRRDAELILDLMLHNEFPHLHRPAVQSREVLRMLRYRQKLIKIRTMSKNSLQALALQAGLAKGSSLFTKAGQQQLSTAENVSGHALATRALAAIAPDAQSTAAGNHGLVQDAKQR
ncbi:MAG: IS110 family transposase, partial [Pyrinomonadaceae bacterium]